MVLKKKIHIKNSRDAVWRYITDPDLLKAWNGNVKALIPVSVGAWEEESRFRMRYAMLGGESNYLAEVMEYRRFEKLVIHLTGGNLQTKGYMQEIYELSDSKDGVLLLLRIEIHKAGINIFRRLAATFIHHFGSQSMKKYLNRLRELVEKNG